jgi:hypothetical protein
MEVGYASPEFVEELAGLGWKSGEDFCPDFFRG